MSTLEARLARLERSNRRLKVILYGALIATSVAALFGMTQPSAIPDVIRAGRFQVVDANGAVLAELASAPGVEGVVAGTIAAYADDGSRLVWMGLNRQGNGSVSVFGDADRELVRLGTLFHGTRQFDTEEQDVHVGRAMIELGINESGTGALATYDDAGHEIVTLTSTTEGLGAFGAFDPDGSPLLLGLPEKGVGGRLLAFKGAGNVTGAWPATPQK